MKDCPEVAPKAFFLHVSPLGSAKSSFSPLELTLAIFFFTFLLVTPEPLRSYIGLNLVHLGHPKSNPKSLGKPHVSRELNLKNRKLWSDIIARPITIIGRLIFNRA